MGERRRLSAAEILFNMSSYLASAIEATDETIHHDVIDFGANLAYRQAQAHLRRLGAIDYEVV